MRSPGRRAHSFRDLLIETKSSMLFFSGGIDICLLYTSLPVKNNTCTGIRSVEKPPQTDDIEELMALYSDALLSQIPCIRMSDISKRRDLIEDPNLRGIIYNTVNFCDFYTFEYSKLKSTLNVPVLKIETDYTMLATEQIKTRLGAVSYTHLDVYKRQHIW